MRLGKSIAVLMSVADSLLPDREERLLFNRGLDVFLQPEQLQAAEGIPSEGVTGGGGDR